MTSAITNAMALWMWPLTTVKLVSDCLETMMSAQSVVQIRMPLIAAAWTDPQTADHRELTRMVSEKTNAFAQSGRSISSAQKKVYRATEANARVLSLMSGGSWVGFGEWTQIFERNLEIATTLASLPTAALAPVHAKATANARRLGKP